MFVVCGRNNKDYFRVLDTDDNVVEAVTLEELKVVQSMGYQIIFDSSYDYINELYGSYPDGNETIRILQTMPYKLITGMTDIKIDYLRLNGLMCFLVYCESKVVLFVIKDEGARCQLVVSNDDIRKLINIKKLGNLTLMDELNDSMCIVYRDENYETFGINFDYDCNYLGVKIWR